VLSPTTLLDQQVGGHGAADLAAARANAPDAPRSMVSQSTDTVLVTVYPKDAADSSATQALVTDLRADAARDLGGVHLVTHLGGNPALLADMTAENTRATPIVIGAVLAASFVPLLFVFRSLVLRSRPSS
jgi:putative drug exporter of the RND superfamily